MSTDNVSSPGLGSDAQLTSQQETVSRRSWLTGLSPFSPKALASLPRLRRPTRYTRADNIPEAGEVATHRNYNAINHLPPKVRIPKKIKTSVKVEGKVWFANERTWISWLSISVLMSALSLGLFNASKDQIARNFAYVYAVISICILVYGYFLYQHRISMIRRRDPGHFGTLLGLLRSSKLLSNLPPPLVDALAGPVLLSIALFTAVLANFIIRVRELKQKEIPIPGSDLVAFFFANTRFGSLIALPFQKSL
ncbi:hypothetical protein D9619_004506 [Psilocybe cf. subviscida]|uniref:DUF202 domain-containing protein n=1 Tax=Psilocybe cf. subviscida TaxID=2480587 RepID=A0A8H5BRP0_9AGAR|nr:hypothetical protein D9619_004506 [Psilocybe cf. subviscida]